jgi:hypothetical protein
MHYTLQQLKAYATQKKNMLMLHIVHHEKQILILEAPNKAWLYVHHIPKNTN